MKILRLFHIFSQIVSVIIIIVIHFFAVAVFQPEKTYPKYVHKTLFLDRNLSQGEVDYIIYAAAEWSESTKHIVEFDVVTLPSKNVTITYNDIVILSVSPDHPDIMLLDMENNGNTLGLYNPESPIPSIYIVSDRIEDKDYPVVVLHELGHALGLEHNEDLNGLWTLMYPSINLGSDHITLYDLKNFCKLYHCDPKKLKN